MRKRWQQKISKSLMQHVRATTTNHTLREVVANVQWQIEQKDPPCFECLEILKKTGKNF
jgi:hypothetical protein